MFSPRPAQGVPLRWLLSFADFLSPAKLQEYRLIRGSHIFHKITGWHLKIVIKPSTRVACCRPHPLPPSTHQRKNTICHTGPVKLLPAASDQYQFDLEQCASDCLRAQAARAVKTRRSAIVTSCSWQAVLVLGTVVHCSYYLHYLYQCETVSGLLKFNNRVFSFLSWWKSFRLLAEELVVTVTSCVLLLPSIIIMSKYSSLSEWNSH